MADPKDNAAVTGGTEAAAPAEEAKVEQEGTVAEGGSVETEQGSGSAENRAEGTESSDSENSDEHSESEESEESEAE